MKYVAMKLSRWENMKAYTPQEQGIQGCGRSIGVLLVYDTLKDLHADEGNNANHIVVELANRKKKGNKHDKRT